MEYQDKKDNCAMPIRAQVPGDAVKQVATGVGKAPMGGFRSMFVFGGSTESNVSPTDFKGKKVY